MWLTILGAILTIMGWGSNWFSWLLPGPLALMGFILPALGIGAALHGMVELTKAGDRIGSRFALFVLFAAVAIPIVLMPGSWWVWLTAFSSYAATLAAWKHLGKRSPPSS